METHDINLVFTSRTENEGLPEADGETRSVLQGRLAEGAGGLYLFFSDRIEHSGKANYTIKIGDGEALLRRAGDLPLRQPLFLGKRMAGSCELPIGQVTTEATAEKIEAAWDRKSGSGAAKLVYELKLQGQFAGKFYLDFRYNLKHKKN